MKVMLVFDEAYGERDGHELGDAFWLVESPSNRALAEQAWAASSTHPNSAIFTTAAPATAQDVCAAVGDIDLHHPAWSEIVVVGFDSIEPLSTELEAEGLEVRPVSGGLSITRRVA